MHLFDGYFGWVVYFSFAFEYDPVATLSYFLGEGVVAEVGEVGS